MSMDSAPKDQKMHESHQTPFPSMWRVRSGDETNFTHTCYFCGTYSMATFIEGWH